MPAARLVRSISGILPALGGLLLGASRPPMPEAVSLSDHVDERHAERPSVAAKAAPPRSSVETESLPGRDRVGTFAQEATLAVSTATPRAPATYLEGSSDEVVLERILAGLDVDSSGSLQDAFDDLVDRMVRDPMLLDAILFRFESEFDAERIGLLIHLLEAAATRADPREGAQLEAAFVDLVVRERNTVRLHGAVHYLLAAAETTGIGEGTYETLRGLVATHPSGVVRSASLWICADRTAADERDDLLLIAAGSDLDPMVRGTAAESLARGATPLGTVDRDRLVALVRDEADAGIRRQLLTVLERRPPAPPCDLPPRAK